MKTSFVSSLSLQTTMRTAVAKAQQDMVAAQQEVTTGRHADVGVALGATTARSLDLTRDVLRIKSMLTTNSLATQRLESSEEALSKMAELGQKVLDSLVGIGSSSDATNLDVARTAIQNSLDTFSNFANTSVNGEYLFSGINTDVKPFEDVAKEGSAAITAFGAELNFFMTNNGIASKSDMTKADMDAFLTEMEAKLDGTSLLTDPPHDPAVAGQDFWSTFVSSASDDNMKSRITQSEIVQTSTNANSQGMRKFVLTSLVSIEFLTSDMSDVAKEEAVSRSTGYIGQAMSGLTGERATLGLSAERVKKADETLDAQMNIIEVHLNDLEAVDAYEASTRVKGLEALVETAYTLTARLQQLSLVNFL
ncbi:flagellar hook-associated family protein [Pseudorhizobium pelagicum]|uniref:Flagellin n=1 Tax=Pseudorhizobium pelagicum TaxID=1509405 RepID=A0A922P3M4_9HYPH|nr:flagellar hook-associated family protein [Pseudorhizobium pelagicum]KEQ09415.1 flagellar hook protein FlgL [Pseudorhizobium pelagicum]KEQ10765.1 flagellar hook protein FlgL [Pseudorhizobium pelagicum]